MPAKPPKQQTIVLSEYGEGELELTAGEERLLRQMAQNRLTFLPGDTSGRWRVKSGSYVGTVVTPAARILVTPKVPIANLFHLLEDGGRTLDLGDEIFEYERTNDLVPSVATFFARHLEVALAQGIPRDYRAYGDRIVGVRGRVYLAGQRRLAGLPLPVDCIFDEYTANISLNRILRGASVRLLRLPGVAATTRRLLTQLVVRLEEVGDVTDADLRSTSIFTRLTEHCRPAEKVARIVLRDAGLLDSVGSAGAAVFLIDMNKVFEEFVESRLRKCLAGRLRVHGQRPVRLDLSGEVRMKPDLVFESADGKVWYVADSKYKVTATGLGQEADYYQLLAYTTALDLPEGLLIYCQHDGMTIPHHIEVRNSGTGLRTRAVCLSGPSGHVEVEMAELANEIVGWTWQSCLRRSA
jgi:5-methylcytosine-specific restriction enzyme subunit McrC